MGTVTAYLFPASDVSVNLVPSTSGYHCVLVDDGVGGDPTTQDGVSTNVNNDGAWKYDSFKLGQIPATAYVFYIKVHICANATAVNCSIRPTINGTELAALTPIGTDGVYRWNTDNSWRLDYQIGTSDPWTYSQINDLTLGIGILGTKDNPAHITSVYLEVVYYAEDATTTTTTTTTTSTTTTTTSTTTSTTTKGPIDESDSFTLSEGIAVIASIPISDVLSTSEALDVAANIQIVDSISQADSLSSSAPVSIQDTLSVSTSLAITTFVSILDFLSLEESTDFVFGPFINDILSLSEVVSISTFISEPDSLLLSDTITITVLISLSDTISISEAVSISEMFLQLDSLILSESIQTLAQIAMFDYLSLSEQVSLIQNVNFGVYDELYISESIIIRTTDIFSISDLEPPELSIPEGTSLDYNLDLSPYVSLTGYSTLITYQVTDVLSNAIIVLPTTFIAHSNNINITISSNTILSIHPYEQRLLSITIKRGHNTYNHNFRYNIERS